MVWLSKSKSIYSLAFLQKIFVDSAPDLAETEYVKKRLRGNMVEGCGMERGRKDRKDEAEEEAYCPPSFVTWSLGAEKVLRMRGSELASWEAILQF